MSSTSRIAFAAALEPQPPRDAQARLKADLALAKTKVQNALISARVAERAANDAAAALERVQAALKAARPPPRLSAPPMASPTPAADALNVRPRQAAQILGCSLSTVWKMIGMGELKTFKRGKARLIRMDSIRAAAVGDAEERP